MENYFYGDNEKTILKESLLTNKARDWAKKFLNPINKYDKLTSAQLRKFYGEVKALETKVDAKGFAQIKPLIKMLKSKAAYSCPINGKKKIPDEFKIFLNEMVDHVEDEQDYKAFAITFEAVVGYFYGEGGR
jgi:CRISPR type III-A-associated protein Csm2